MKVNAESKVGQLVAENYRTADIFKKYGIDFCCGGGKSIEEVCLKKQLDQDELLQELSNILETSSNTLADYKNKSTKELVDIIVNRHHAYVAANIPILQEYLKKIYAVHGQNHPELEEVYTQFLLSSDELAKHMEKEESILFPYLVKMESGEKTEKPNTTEVINEMLNEHENEGQRFALIQEITNDFQFPFDACNTYKVAFHKLKEFQNDLHLHIHLENNILFPRAVRMEQEIS